MEKNITTDDNIFNKVIEQAFIKFGLLKPNNYNGILTVEEVRNENWTTYNWVDEVNCLKCYNINEFDQSNYDLAQLQSSKIVKKFLDVAGMLNQRLSGLTYTIQGQTIVVSDYINDGLPLTNEDLASRSWSREANGIDDLKYALNGSSVYSVKNNLTVICTYGNDTYAKEAAAKILAVLNNI